MHPAVPKREKDTTDCLSIPLADPCTAAPRALRFVSAILLGTVAHHSALCTPDEEKDEEEEGFHPGQVPWAGQEQLLK